MNLRCLGKKSNQKTQVRKMLPPTFRVAARVWLMSMFIFLIKAFANLVPRFLTGHQTTAN